MVTLKRDHELIRSGPYRRVRHPIYTGLLLAVLGSAIALALITAALLQDQHREPLSRAAVRRRLSPVS